MFNVCVWLGRYYLNFDCINDCAKWRPDSAAIRICNLLKDSDFYILMIAKIIFLLIAYNEFKGLSQLCPHMISFVIYLFVIFVYI